MKLKLFFLSLISLLTVVTVQANVVLPPFLMYFAVKYYLLGWLILPIGFAIEWYCVHQFIGKELKGSFIATLVINIVSTILGIPLAFPIVGMRSLTHPFFTPEQLAIFSVWGFTGVVVVNAVVFVLGSIIANVLTEGGTAVLLYKIKNKKRMLKWLIIANVSSFGVGAAVVAFKHYRFEKEKLERKKQRREQLEQTMTPRQRKEREKIRRRLEKHKPKVIKKIEK